MSSSFFTSKEHIENVISDIIATEADLFSLTLPPKIQIDNKYNEFIPPELLKKQFVYDFLDLEGMRSDMKNPE